MTVGTARVYVYLRNKSYYDIRNLFNDTAKRVASHVRAAMEEHAVFEHFDETSMLVIDGSEIIAYRVDYGKE